MNRLNVAAAISLCATLFLVLPIVVAEDVGSPPAGSSCLLQSAALNNVIEPPPKGTSAAPELPVEEHEQVISQIQVLPSSLKANHTLDSGIGIGIVPASCPRVHALFPAGVLLAMLMLALTWRMHACSNSDIAEKARTISLFVQFCGMSTYSIVILESYQLSKALGHDAEFSGQVIGIYMAAAAFGGLIMSLVLWYHPDIWKLRARELLLFTQMGGMIGFSMYAWVTSYVTYNSIDTADGANDLSNALLLARVISGIGHGIIAFLLQVTFAHITPAHERPIQMTRFWFVCTLGIGVGPMIAAGMRLLDFCHVQPAHTPRFDLVGLGQLVLAAVSLCSVFLFFPKLDDVEDFVATDSCAVTSGSAPVNRLFFCGCMLNTTVRAIVTSGVEAATSLLLETQFGFSQQDIGVMIGATFLCCLPAKAALDYSRQRTTVSQCTRALCGLSIFGCCFLFRRSWYCLLFADALLFPSLYLSDGIVRGLMQQYALPPGSLLDQTGTTLWSMLLNNTGRCLGPWVARGLLQKVNQSAYAGLQLFLALVFWVVFETIIAPTHSSAEATVTKSSGNVASSNNAARAG